MRNDWLLKIFQFFYSPFLNWIAVAVHNFRRGISTPTETISTRLSCHSASSPCTKQWCKKNGEFLSRVNFLQWFLLTILPINLMSTPPTRNVGYLRPQTGYHHAHHATPLHRNIRRGDAKRTVIFCPESIFLQWFLLTIFSIKLLSASPTCNVGYLHRQTEFQHASHATRSHHHVQSGDAKRMVSFCPESFFTVNSTHHFFN